LLCTAADTACCRGEIWSRDARAESRLILGQDVLSIGAVLLPWSARNSVGSDEPVIRERQVPVPIARKVNRDEHSGCI
jgi:hypothetical protein